MSEMERAKEEEERNEVELEPKFSSLRPGRGFRPSTKREQIRMKLHQSKKKVDSFWKLCDKNTFSFQKTAGKPTRKLRLRPRFRPSNPPVDPVPVEVEDIVQQKEEELEEGDRLLQGKLEELAVLEQQLEELEEVMRQPKQIKDDDEVVPAKKIRKRVKKRRRKPVKVEEVNGLGREVVKKIRKKEKEQLEDNLIGSRLPSVFLEPLEATRSAQSPARLAPSPSPQLNPSPTPRFSPAAPTQPPQPPSRPTPSFSPETSLPAQLRFTPTPRFALEARRIEPKVPTSPALPPPIPKEAIPTSIPILRSPIQFAAPSSSLPTIPSTRAPTRFSPSLNQISQVPPPFPIRSPIRPPSSPSFPRFPLPDFFSLPFPEMRQGRSSPPGGGGGLFNAIGVPQVSFINLIKSRRLTANAPGFPGERVQYRNGGVHSLNTSLVSPSVQRGLSLSDMTLCLVMGLIMLYILSLSKILWH